MPEDDGSWHWSSVAWQRIIRGGHWSPTLLLGALLCIPNICRAEDATLALDYDAHDSCPTRDAFLDLVHQKLTAAGARGNLEEPHVAVRIQPVEAGFVGQLALQRSDASTEDREVTGASCTEVADALAFVLALALGEKAAPAPAPVAAQDTPVPVEAEAPPSPSASPPVVPAGPAVHAEKPRPAPWRLGFGVQTGERTGLSPLTQFVGSVVLELVRKSGSLSGAGVRAGFAFAPSSSANVPDGSADFSWWAGSLEVCPLQVRVLGPLRAHPCAAVDVGRLLVTGIPTLAPSGQGSASSLWVDVAAGLRLELPIVRSLSAELEGEVIVPLTRDKFAFDPGARVYQAPQVAGAGLIGLMAHFP